MPTYQYACTECDHRFEQVQSFSDDALAECPECEGRLRKLFNAVGVVFKGSGFYRNDSRADGAGASKVAANGSGDKSAGDTKTETAPSDKGSSDKGSSDKAASGSSDKGSSSTGSSSKTASSSPAAAAS